MVLLVPNTNPGSCSKANLRRRAIAARCRFVGLEVAIDKSRAEDARLIKLSAPDELLEEVAELLTLEKRLKFGGHTDFTRANKKLFLPASPTAFFSSLERCRLVLAILELGLAEGGCDIDLNKELADGVISAVVPVHDPAVSEDKLMKRWALAPLRAWPDQPLDEIRDYFGEQIAMYFAFVQALTRSLIVPSAVGLVAVAGSLIYGTPDNPLCPLYSLFILFWITGFCKMWRQEEARLAFRWNVEHFESTERERPEFRGPLARGFYSREGYFVDVLSDDKLASAAPLSRKFTHEERERRMLSSLCVITLIMVGVVVGVVGVLAYRSFLQLSFAAARRLEIGGVLELDFDPAQHSSVPELSAQHGEEHVKLPTTYAVTLGSVFGGMANSAFILVTNVLYADVARRLNERENHRTETAHADALILKTFTFQFVNSYASLFYIAFVKAAQVNVIGGLGLSSTPEYCHNLAVYSESAEEIRAEHGGLNPYCMGELSTLLTSLVVTSQITGKLVEVVVPALSGWYRAWVEERAMRRRFATSPPMSFYEKQCKLEPFGGVFDEYSRLVIQIGYIVLFAPAFPIASLVCYGLLLLELRNGALKLLATTQRPRYAGAQDIGSWQKVLVAIGLVATLTNLGLIGYTSTAFSSLLPFSLLGVQIDEGNKALFLIGCEHLVFAAQLVVLYALPDSSEALAVSRARSNWRRKAALALAASGGKPIVVDGNEAVKPPPVDWDDDAVPERFWQEHSDAALVEPRQGREWARLVKAGEYKASEGAAERQREANAQRLVQGRGALAARNAALGISNDGVGLVSAAPLPPPARHETCAPSSTKGMPAKLSSAPAVGAI